MTDEQMKISLNWRSPLALYRHLSLTSQRPRFTIIRKDIPGRP